MTSRPGLADALTKLLREDGLVLVAPDFQALAPRMRENGVQAQLASRQPGDSVLSRSLPHLSADSAADAFRRATAAVTGAAIGIAASGSVAVTERGGYTGMLSCLPPHHVAVLEETAIVDTLEDGLSAMFADFPSHNGRFVLVTGPSRTADIEMMSVLGVHGPLRLDVVVVGGE